MQKVLEVKNLEVVLDGEKILENINFTINKGDVLTVIGPNGAGKTVLLKVLLGIFPYSGEVKWRKGIKVSYVPQRVPFWKDIPINVKEFFKLKNIDERKIEEITNLIGINKDILNKQIGKISSGQFQRILIGFALSSNPNVLLFDEPVSGIDIEGQETIYETLEKLHKTKELTIILVSHDLNIVYRFSTKVLCLTHRKMLCIGEPKKILSSETLEKLFKSEVKIYKHSY